MQQTLGGSLPKVGLLFTTACTIKLEWTHGRKTQSLAIEEEWVKYLYLSIRDPANGLTKICKVTIKQESYYS